MPASFLSFLASSTNPPTHPSLGCVCAGRHPLPPRGAEPPRLGALQPPPQAIPLRADERGCQVPHSNRLPTQAQELRGKLLAPPHAHLVCLSVCLSVCFTFAGLRPQHRGSIPGEKHPAVSLALSLNPTAFLLCACRLSSWCNVQLFIHIRFFMETWKLFRQYLEEARRARGRRRRLKGRPPPPATEEAEEWVVARHNFAEPTSGGLVATFMELLYSKSVRRTPTSQSSFN